MSLGPFFKSKRSIMMLIAFIFAIFTIYCFVQYRYLDSQYSILPVAGQTPSYAASTSNWLAQRQHPDGFFVTNPDTFNEPSALNRETVRLSRHAILALNELGSLDTVDKETLVDFLLQNYQSPSNAIGNLKGFSALPNSAVNIRTTLDSVIILNKLEALDRIDRNAVASLILAYQNDDGGFWDPGYPQFGQQSTLQATSAAIRTLRHLNQLNDDIFSQDAQQRVNQFISSAWSNESKAFSPFPGYPQISSYDAFRAWTSIYYLPINHDQQQRIDQILHIEELIATLNSSYITDDNVYSESESTNRNSLRASHVLTLMLTSMGKLEYLPSEGIIQFIQEYRDNKGGFSTDIYSVYSAVDTLRLLAPTRMSGKILTYKLLSYAGLLVTLICVLIAILFFRKVASYRRSALVHKAQTDRLTGLNNREFLERRYQIYQNDNSYTALVLLDLDHFKSINDTYGHLVGDEVLIEVSKLLRDNIRKTDTLARWGGEEFAILCPATAPDHSEVFCEKIRVLVEQHKFSGVPEVTCSIGVSCSKQNEPLKELFARADKALYESKKHGRNKVTYL